ncbi:MAG: hypothetical protein ACI8UD_001346 [Planctomycetota bacterium]
MQGVALSGVRAGQRDVRVGRGTRDEPFVVAPLCADFDGFSLHGAVRVAAGDRKRLEHLCRYAGRPAIAESRLSRLPDGRVAYSLKKTWRDGSTHVVMEPQVLIERLLALVPRLTGSRGGGIVAEWGSDGPNRSLNYLHPYSPSAESVQNRPGVRLGSDTWRRARASLQFLKNLIHCASPTPAAGSIGQRCTSPSNTNWPTTPPH